uniref:tRNA-yW synthesizing n=1 Tax=Eptatretus burgeri TaxID=7764 RepID=A0A8C4NNW0_EPTBU
STVIHLKDYDPEDGLLEEARNGSLCAFVLPTYTEGNPPDAAAWFCKWLSEAANDFRYGKTHLSGLRYIVLGLGNSFYEEHYNKVARNVDKWLWHLGARGLMPRGETDKNSSQSRHGSAEADFAAWLQQVRRRLGQLISSKDIKVVDPEEHSHCCANKLSKGQGRRKAQKESSGHGSNLRSEEGSYEYETTSEEDEGDTDGDLESLVDVEDLGIVMKDMPNSKVSLVTECRCKLSPICVFHLKMLRQDSSYAKSEPTCHSLPPTPHRNLEPVTQLYVSVDASSERSLKRIDRPLFKDFWSRFLGSLQALSEKGQRTVYRLTLVKAWNVDEIQAYAELVTLGQPDFIEVKGVTYCGEGGANSLTMANVPWHEEVVSFVTHLADLLPNYEIACEHAHSNCLLLAHTRFKRDGVWWTWIDYDRFHTLYQEHESTGGLRTFSAEDYAAPTPVWALFGSSGQGFDPVETRHLRRGKPKDISGC